MTTVDDGFIDAATNPAAAHAAAALIDEVNASAFGEVESKEDVIVPSISHPTANFSRLPGGLQTSAGSVTAFEVRELTGSDEERIAKARASDDQSRFFSTIIECGTVSVGSSKDRNVFDQMLVGDREYLALAIRDATFGSEIECGTVLCTGCGDLYEAVVNTTDIPVKTLEKPSDRDFVVPLRKGGKAFVSLPTVADSRAYLDDLTLTTAERNSILLTRCVSEIVDTEGDSFPIAGFPSLVRDMLSLVDRRTILEEISNRMPGPRYDQVTVKHSCGEEEIMPIGLMSLFPGL